METEPAIGREWDLTPYFPGIESEAFSTFVREFGRRLEQFEQDARACSPVPAKRVENLATLLAGLEQLEAVRDHLTAYGSLAYSVSPGDEAVQRANDAILRLSAVLKAAIFWVVKALAALPDEARESLMDDERLRDADYKLSELLRRSRSALSADEENLVSSLARDGLHRWARLAAQTLADAKIAVTFPDGRAESMSLGRKYDLLWDPRPSVRGSAHRGIAEAMRERAPVLANCFNATAGFEISIARRRGEDIVADAMRSNHVEPATIDIMMDRVRAGAPLLRRYLDLKARILGLERWGIQDRSAPLPLAHSGLFSYSGTRRLIEAAFRPASPRWADLVATMYEARRIEANTRPGRQPGGFCIPSPVLRQSYIYLNFSPSLNGAAVLAHEFGHAFHNEAAFDLRPWHQKQPATLAETAAIVGEQLFRRSLYDGDVHPKDLRLCALASELDAAVNFLLRIPRDYEFERAFFEERAQGEVTVSRLRALAREKHFRWFGDTSASDGGDEWGWAHNHIMMNPGLRLYNFPYTFGYLLALGISGEFASQNREAERKFVALLRTSGATSAERAVRDSFGYEIRSPDFWDDCFRRIDAKVRLFESLVGRP